ncbi:MAG: M23 family metallopeptidase [Spirochaetes bacterium]|nr:MAG: M23 family metallopeptidase [Spirochaetota bacterium]
MNRRHFTLATIAFIAVLLLLALYTNIVAGGAKKKSPDDGMAALEQAVIMNGLSMFSENPLREDEEEAGEGQIIYDESFDDTIASLGPEEKDGGSDTQVDSPAHAARTVLAELKEKDSRWHLTNYRIAKGDNLWTIAKRYGVDHRLIIRANEIETPAMLAPGNVIMVPNRNGVSHTVKPGETIKSISGTYRVTPRSIQEQNKSMVLKTNTTIFIPDARKPERLAAKAAVAVSKPAAGLGIALAWPVRGGITSGFGNRLDPFTRRPQFHCGVDIYVPIDTPVMCAAAGSVIFSGWKDGYGNMVVVSHPGGYITVYAHNKQNTVAAGAEVKQGQQVALSGMTGAVTGPHVHFELRKYLTPLNPLRFIR